jgi:hypothetical protein
MSGYVNMARRGGMSGQFRGLALVGVNDSG